MDRGAHDGNGVIFGLLFLRCNRFDGVQWVMVVFRSARLHHELHTVSSFLKVYVAEGLLKVYRTQDTGNQQQDVFFCSSFFPCSLKPLFSYLKGP